MMVGHDFTDMMVDLKVTMVVVGCNGGESVPGDDQHSLTSELEGKHILI